MAGSNDHYIQADGLGGSGTHSNQNAEAQRESGGSTISMRFPCEISYDSHERIGLVMLMELMTTLEAGETLDHYRLDATVARSGMSTLYRATDLRDGRQVALKIPHAEMEADPVLLERFKREQEIGQELDHPGMVKTYDGEERSRLYMVIEWVEGRLLRAILNERSGTSCRSTVQ